MQAVPAVTIFAASGTSSVRAEEEQRQARHGTVGKLLIEAPIAGIQRTLQRRVFFFAAGEKSRAQIEAFGDTWHWGEEAELAFDGVMTGPNTDAAEMLRSIRSFLKENDMMAYLCMMAVRLLELQPRVETHGESLPALRSDRKPLPENLT